MKAAMRFKSGDTELSFEKLEAGEDSMVVDWRDRHVVSGVTVILKSQILFDEAQLQNLRDFLDQQLKVIQSSTKKKQPK